MTQSYIYLRSWTELVHFPSFWCVEVRGNHRSAVLTRARARFLPMSFRRFGFGARGAEQGGVHQPRRGRRPKGLRTTDNQVRRREPGQSQQQRISAGKIYVFIFLDFNGKTLLCLPDPKLEVEGTTHDICSSGPKHRRSFPQLCLVFR